MFIPNWALALIISIMVYEIYRLIAGPSRRKMCKQALARGVMNLSQGGKVAFTGYDLVDDARLDSRHLLSFSRRVFCSSERDVWGPESSRVDAFILRAERRGWFEERRGFRWKVTQAAQWKVTDKGYRKIYKMAQ